MATCSYGLELINERQSISGTLTTSFYGYDGHGSVRFLTSSTGAITDSYDYDAFGPHQAFVWQPQSESKRDK